MPPKDNQQGTVVPTYVHEVEPSSAATVVVADRQYSFTLLPWFRPLPSHLHVRMYSTRVSRTAFYGATACIWYTGSTRNGTPIIQK